MNVRLDDLTSPEVLLLLKEHLDNMYQITPPESVHALAIEQLRRPDIAFWTAWEDEELLGCGALKELSSSHGEIKSMRTAFRHRRKGVAKEILNYIIAEARRRSYARLSLETGSLKEFEPARKLYEVFGFKVCAPFGDYIRDPNSIFMTLEL
jgi:putative acetyltransferase